MRSVSVLLVIALLGCSGSSSTGAQPDRADQPEPAPTTPAPSEPAPEPSEPAPPGPPPGPHPDELHELEGQTRAAILERFGEPTRKREFTMAHCCTEFEIELQNTYPPGAGHDDVEIHEWTWDYDGYLLTVWLHEQDGEWRVLETCRYSDDVEF